MTAMPLLLRAAFPSGLKSIPRCLAMAADTGVISNSPTPILLADSCAVQNEVKHKEYIQAI